MQHTKKKYALTSKNNNWNNVLMKININNLLSFAK